MRCWGQMAGCSKMPFAIKIGVWSYRTHVLPTSGHSADQCLRGSSCWPASRVLEDPQRRHPPGRFPTLPPRGFVLSLLKGPKLQLTCPSPERLCRSRPAACPLTTVTELRGGLGAVTARGVSVSKDVAWEAVVPGLREDTGTRAGGLRYLTGTPGGIGSLLGWCPTSMADTWPRWGWDQPACRGALVWAAPGKAETLSQTPFFLLF